MATSSTSTFDLPRDRMIRRALQLAQVLEASQQPSADDIDLGADLLQIELLELQADGANVIQTTRTTLDLVDGTAEYTLPSDTFDVQIDGNNFAGTIVASTGTETPLRAISRLDYLSIPDKDVEATPTLVFVERLVDQVKVCFWPVPDDSTLDYRYAQIRLARDSSPGTVTMDASRRWQKALTFALAYQLSITKSADPRTRDELKREAAEARARAMNSDVGKGHIQFYVQGRG